MNRWWDSEAASVGGSRIGGTGSISCLAITDRDAEEAAARRAPLGFRADVPDDWGEAGWTAPDLRAAP